jgi:hypothetical protein
MTVYRAPIRGFGVYLSGPIEGCTEEEAYGWRREAEMQLIDRMPVFTPPRASDSADSHEMKRLVKVDLSDIDEARYILANPWKTSTGTPMEIMYGHLQGKIIVVIARPDGFVSPWVRYHADYVASDVMSACEFIRGERG